MKTENSTAWFESWFDSPYYPILYNHRNQKEAEKFISQLINTLSVPNGSSMLDVACGRGRHSIYLASLGYDVTGIDLSPKSIEYAIQFSNDKLSFEVHDMRIPYPKKVDVLLNLFTSFGYFDDDSDHLVALKAFRKNLNPNGIAIIDFLNINYVTEHLIPHETIQKKNIRFNIQRQIADGYITKTISFETEKKSYVFYEKVRALSYFDFKKLLDDAHLRILNCWGGYNLKPFHSQLSDRLILCITPSRL